jgi:hypothetical protein
VVVGIVVVPPEGVGAPVENRHPPPGGEKAAMLTIGGGRFFAGPDGWVVGVVDVEGPLVVVGPVGVVEGVVNVVVATAAVGWCSSFNWKPTTMSAETHSPSTTRRGQLGWAPSRTDSLGI